MHLTLKKEASKPAAANFLQQQTRFDIAISLIFIAQSVFLARFFWRTGFWRSTHLLV
jgi:hypothetical protein